MAQTLITARKNKQMRDHGKPDRTMFCQAFFRCVLIATETAEACSLYCSYSPEVSPLKQTIYVDVLLAVNLFVNYFLLLTVRGFLHLTVSRLRLLLGAAVGAAGSLSILLPTLSPVLSVLFQLVLSAAIVFSSFWRQRLGQLLRAFVCFYLISFAYAGFMLAIWYFVSPERIVIKNSVVYFEVPPLLLALLSVAAYGIVSLLSRLAGQREADGGFCKLTVCLDGREVSCVGKLDTGSTLMEPFSRDPVVVASRPVLKDLLVQSLPGFLEDPDAGNAAPDFAEAGSSVQNIRMIPYSDLSGTGVLPAFRPECLRIRQGNRVIEVRDCYVAVRREPFPGGTFDALLNPAFLTRGNHNRKGKEEMV